MKILDKEFITNSYIKLIKLKLLTKSNDEIEREYITKNSDKLTNGCVSVVVFNSDTNSFIFVKQFRYAINDIILENVAGIIEVGVKPIEVAKKEVLEEVGYNVNDKNIILFGKYFSSPGCMDELNYFYVAYVTNEDKYSSGGGLLIEHEEIEVVEVHQNDINSLNIVDLKTKFGLEFVKNDKYFNAKYNTLYKF